MNDYLLGGSAAIATAILWSGNSILFAAAGKRIGALSVNAYRIVVAALLLGLAHILLFGTVAPHANGEQWFWLGVSGIIGLGIGDFALFTAFVVLGPRRSLLMMSLAPVCSAVFGYLILGEILEFWAIVGITVTLAGIIIVILEKEETADTGVLVKIESLNSFLTSIKKNQRTYGVLLGAIGGAGQGIGLVLSKYGMFNVADDPSVPLPSLSATLIRIFIGAIFIWICVAVIKRYRQVVRKSFSDRIALLFSSGGAFIGPFLGVWLSMVSVTYIHVGIAQTLMSLMPVIIIPMVWIIYGEKTSWRGIFGASVAVLGVAILFLL